MQTLQSLFRLIIGAFTFTYLINNVVAQSIPIAYCSTLNTATTNGNASIYQTEGLCYNFCLSSYAFAVLQGNQCWCSNYVPGSGTTSTSSCDGQCVGYPDDWCGNESQGLYGYIALSIQPSGTHGASSAAASTSSTTQQVTVTQSTTAPPLTVMSTLISTVTPTTSLASTRKTSTSQTTAAARTTSASSSQSSTMSTSTWTPTPVVSVVTAGGGSVKTVTVTPTSQAQSSNEAAVSNASNNGGGLSTGGAVGLTVGLVALVALIGAIVFCCVRRRRKAAAAAAAAAYEDHSPRGSSAGGLPQRTMSENSRYMLGTDGSRVVEAWQEDDGAGSRRSRLMPVDPRLDPFAPVYQRGDASKSRESVATIQDNHDYSRRMVGNGKGPLRAINPDND